MEELWSATSYAPHLLSLPFALAPAAMSIVIAYAAVMRGAPVLRLFLLVHCLALLPYGLVMMLSPSVTSPAAAEQLFRVGASTIALAAAAGTGLQLALIRRLQPVRWVVYAGVASALVWVVVSSATGAVVGDVRRLQGFYYPIAGEWAWLALLHTVILSVPGFAALGYVAWTSPPSDERRQLRAAFTANLVTYAGLVDVGLAYGVGVFPLGWLLSGAGSLLFVRALVVEDLLRVRAIDTTAPLLVVHLIGAIVVGWVLLLLLGRDAPWWAVTGVLALAFAAVRMLIAAIVLMTRGARHVHGPLKRLLAQLVGRARALRDAPDIARLALDVLDLGVGIRARILLASEADWGWTTETGERLDDALAPDPLLIGWLGEQRGTAALFAGDLEAVPADLRPLLAPLFEGHRARAVVAVRSADEVLGLVLVPAAAGVPLRGPALAFLERGAERLAEALLHARMARRAAARAAIAREVELAATVQAELLPGTEPHVHGDLTVVGSWQPATRCAGDFWGVYPLGDDRVLLAIGDVTGHGVASAMVTAAACGACDASARRGGTRLELRELIAALDVAVRRAGGGQLAMTCFASIIDARARTIAYVSCGHAAPYLCRPARGARDREAIELHALVGRGNPLGAAAPATPKIHQKTLAAGDLIVCYTDGVIEAHDPGGTPFGDRKLQRLLRKVDPQRLAPQPVHDLIQSGVAAHRAGLPLADDETVVVAQLAGGAP